MVLKIKDNEIIKLHTHCDKHLMHQSFCPTKHLPSNKTARSIESFPVIIIIIIIK